MAKNSIISGILSVAVFFMGVTISVAQKQSAANGNAEVMESVEAMVLAPTVVKVNAEFAERQAKLIAAKAEVMKAPTTQESAVQVSTANSRGISVVTVGSEVKVKNKVMVPTTYYQTAEGTYVRTNPNTNCLLSSNLPCTVTFDDDPGVTSFEIANISELDDFGIDYDISENGKRQ